MDYKGHRDSKYLYKFLKLLNAINASKRKSQLIAPLDTDLIDDKRIKTSLQSPTLIFAPMDHNFNLQL